MSHVVSSEEQLAVSCVLGTVTATVLTFLLGVYVLQNDPSGKASLRPTYDTTNVVCPACRFPAWYQEEGARQGEFGGVVDSARFAAIIEKENAVLDR